MVIVNEYHHVAAFSFEKARKVAKVKYPAVGTLTVTWVFTPEDGVEQNTGGFGWGRNAAHTAKSF